MVDANVLDECFTYPPFDRRRQAHPMATHWPLTSRLESTIGDILDKMDEAIEQIVDVRVQTNRFAHKDPGDIMRILLHVRQQLREVIDEGRCSMPNIPAPPINPALNVACARAREIDEMFRGAATIPRGLDEERYALVNQIADLMTEMHPGTES